MFTDVPISGVLVDGFIWREGMVLSTLQDLLDKAPENEKRMRAVKKDHLVNEVEARYPGRWPTQKALDRWIRRASKWLKVASGSHKYAGEFRYIRWFDDYSLYTAPTSPSNDTLSQTIPYPALDTQ